MYVHVECLVSSVCFNKTGGITKDENRQSENMKKMASKHLANGVAMAFLLALSAGLVYLTVLISSNTFADDSRVKRSSATDNEFLFKNRVHWTKSSKQPSLNNEAESSADDLLNPSRFDKKSPLEYIFISVKTATKFHMNRLQVIIDTWYNLAPDQVRLSSVWVVIT